MSSQRGESITRARIDGRLHTIGDMVYIPSLGYNGTIAKLTRGGAIDKIYATVVPHDYGQVSYLFLHELKHGSGISHRVRGWLRNNDISVNDPVVIRKLTHIHPKRPHFLRYNRPPSRQVLLSTSDYRHPFNRSRPSY